MSLDISINTIKHAEQRYDTAGDWLAEEAGPIEIRVSDCGNWRYEALVAVHELVEALLCLHGGITQARVDAFDIDFEHSRAEGNTGEPGDDPRAPYRRQHSFATGIERLLAEALAVDWAKYAQTLNALSTKEEKAA